MYNAEIQKLQTIFTDLSDMGIKTTSLAGEIGERMIQEKIGGELAKFNQTGFDVVNKFDGTKHQVKARVYYGDGKQSGNPESFLFSVKDNDWDILDLLVLNHSGQNIRWATLTKEQVKDVANVNKAGNFNLTFNMLDKLDLAEKDLWEEV